MYETFKSYFRVLNTRRPKRGEREEIFAYNDGLFQPDEVLDNISIDEELLAIHTLQLSEYGFETNVDVNILGHIFEHSLGEIAETKAIITHDLSEANTAYFPQKHLDSIVFNLISNSLKYRTPDRTPRIHIKTYKKEEWTYFEITDNGLGIDLNKNGDKIFMLRKTFHDHPQAKGFGLFITKAQVEAMGGSI